ncbi:MAG: hypothetical protein JWR84_4074 [Caulobacter sp.]|nr:hypothetical protein [Caulobacter sp.]
MKAWILAAVAAACAPTLALGQTEARPRGVLPAGANIVVEIAEQVDSRDFKRGDYFAIRLAEDVKVGDQVVIPAGTPGRGQVIHVGRLGELSGPGEIEVAARDLLVDGRPVPLRGLRLSRRGRVEVVATARGSHVFLGFPRSWEKREAFGYHAVLKPGVRGDAALAEDLPIAVELAAAPKMWSPPALPPGLPPPSAGKAQVVFFRERSRPVWLLDFDIRAGSPEGAVVGSLANGSYFVIEVEPGVHTFFGSEAASDPLVVEAEAGGAYFVMTLLMLSPEGQARANLVPSYGAYFKSLSSVDPLKLLRK